MNQLSAAAARGGKGRPLAAGGTNGEEAAAVLATWGLLRKAGLRRCCSGPLD